MFKFLELQGGGRLKFATGSGRLLLNIEAPAPEPELGSTSFVSVRRRRVPDEDEEAVLALLVLFAVSTRGGGRGHVRKDDGHRNARI